LNPAKQGRKAAFNRAGDAAQRSRWTFYEAIKIEKPAISACWNSDLLPGIISTRGLYWKNRSDALCVLG